MTKYATLSLGTRQDAATWERGCQSLGFRAGLSIRKGSPLDSELQSFFADDANWIYFGGHFGGTELSNEGGSTRITFSREKVTVKKGASTLMMAKGEGFKLHSSVLVVLWGGCSVCSGDATIQTLRALFGPHVLLGFAGETGWLMVNTMLGGGAIKKNHFFRRLAKGQANASQVVEAWMETARPFYGKGPNESKFRAIDTDGQEWKIRNGVVVKGRSFR